MTQLVLSLFPGIGLLDMAFEENGFTVVRGPDVLWGGDVRRFSPPAGRFDGVIGGPPCQCFSSLARLNRHLGNEPSFGDLIPEFVRVVEEAHAKWFLMENVVDAPVPAPIGYEVNDILLRDDWVGGATMRLRRFTFGRPPRPSCRPSSFDGCYPVHICAHPYQFVVEGEALHSTEPVRAVTGDARVHTTGHRIRSRKRGGGTLPNTGKLVPLAQMAEQQGIAASFFDHSPFTHHAKRKMLGNGVPLPMGRAVARAVKRALGIA